MITLTSFPKPKDSFPHVPPKLLTTDDNGLDTNVYEDDDAERTLTSIFDFRMVSRFVSIEVSHEIGVDIPNGV